MKLSIPLADGTILVYEGTEEELSKIGLQFVAKSGSDITSMDEARRLGGITVRVNGASRRWSEHSLLRLWGLLYGEQAKLVRFLCDRGTASYQQVAKHMGYDAQRLSGILSPITRNTQTATGDRLARLIDWRLDDEGERQYFIDPDALPILKKTLST
jgi:hypothetical protein